jgi:peptide/nickel transport system substrate-binding protein
MVRIKYPLLTLLALFFFSVTTVIPLASLAEEETNPRGTLKVVDFWGAAFAVINNYAEGLVTLDKDNNRIPCLAEGWKWIDEQTIEFKLRRGVSFQNGETFNAEALRINWEAYKELLLPSPHYMKIPKETVFESVDDYTVRFTFPEPDGLALAKFGGFIQIAPAFFTGHEFVKYTWGSLAEPGPWGTGPFELVEGGLTQWKTSDRVVLEANKNYWDTRYPKVKTVIFDNTFRKSREEAMRLCRETEGAVDIVTFIRALDTLKVAKSPFAKVVKSRDSTQIHSAINQRKPNSKWRDIRLRKAVSYAINREELMEYGAKGNAFNLGGHIPPGERGYNPNLRLYTYDTTKAKALLAEAGYPDGFEMTLITPEAHKLEAQVMKRMYERIGLTVNLEVFSWGDWQLKVWMGPGERAEDQTWDISVCYNNDWNGHSGASHLIYPVLDASRIRWCEYDPKYEKMWKDMAQTVDEAAQDEKMRQMEQYLYDRAYAIYIYSPMNLYAINKEVNFVPQKSQTLRLKETSVTDNHWSVR